MKHTCINWWKVSSIAFMAASALLGLGHDLIEDKMTTNDIQQMVAEEVRKQLADMNKTK